MELQRRWLELPSVTARIELHKQTGKNLFWLPIAAHLILISSDRAVSDPVYLSSPSVAECQSYALPRWRWFFEQGIAQELADAEVSEKSTEQNAKTEKG